MPTEIPFSITNDTVTVILDGKPYSLKRADKGFQALLDAVRAQDEDLIVKLISPGLGIERWSRGAFTFKDGQVSYRGEELPVDLHRRMLQMASNGDDPRPLMRFWERLIKNPSFRVVRALYPFIAQKGLPIQPDGTFLAYKGVLTNYKDQHSKTFVNAVGAKFRIPRNKVSDDPRVACAEGFHAGTYSYAKGYGARVVIVKIDPADAICVPYDSNEKIRVAAYVVVGHYGDQVLSDTLWDDDADWNWDDTDPIALTPEVQPVQPVQPAPDSHAPANAKPSTPQVDIAKVEGTKPVRLYDVQLVSGGTRITNTIQVVRAITGVGVKEAKEIVETMLPYTLKDGVTRTEAEKARALVRNAGAVCKVLQQKFSTDAVQPLPEEVPLPTAPTREAVPTVTPVSGTPEFNELDSYSAERMLMEVSAHWLRKYAAHLKIFGSSKMKGGKEALVRRIIEVRSK